MRRFVFGFAEEAGFPGRLREIQRSKYHLSPRSSRVSVMLLMLFGPPAVGKMTVGRAVCARSTFRLFHNHMTIEPLAETFGHGSPQFNRLNDAFRRQVLEEAASSGIDLIFTYVWGVELEEDLALTKAYAEIFDGDVAFVELRAGLDTRLDRNHTPGRLADKRSKRDLDWSDDNVRSMEQHRMTTEQPSIADELLTAHPHLVLDNTHLSPNQTASCIVDWLETARS